MEENNRKIEEAQRKLVSAIPFGSGHSNDLSLPPFQTPLRVLFLTENFTNLETNFILVKVFLFMS